MARKKIIIFSLIAFIFFASAMPFDVFAIGLQDSNKFLEEAAQYSGYDISKTETEPIIASIIKSLLSFLGVVFFLLVIYGGFMWMTAQGSEDQVGKAKKIIINSTIGLVVIMLAYAITWFIIYQVIESTGFQQS